MQVWNLSKYKLPYEEGSFTPELQFGSLSTGITYQQQYGFYTKIGNVVNIYVIILLTSKGTATGQATIKGLPFASQHLDRNPIECSEYYMTLLSELPMWTVNGSYIWVYDEVFGVPSTIWQRTNIDFRDWSWFRLMGTYFI